MSKSAIVRVSLLRKEIGPSIGLRLGSLGGQSCSWTEAGGTRGTFPMPRVSGVGVGGVCAFLLGHTDRLLVLLR